MNRQPYGHQGENVNTALFSQKGSRSKQRDQNRPCPLNLVFIGWRGLEKSVQSQKCKEGVSHFSVARRQEDRLKEKADQKAVKRYPKQPGQPADLMIQIQ